MGNKYNVFQGTSHLIQTQASPSGPTNGTSEESYFLQKEEITPGAQGEQLRYRSPYRCPKLRDWSPNIGGYKAKKKTQHKHRLLQWSWLTLFPSCYGNSKQNIFLWHSESFHSEPNTFVCSDHTESLVTSFSCYIGLKKCWDACPLKGKHIFLFSKRDASHRTGEKLAWLFLVDFFLPNPNLFTHPKKPKSLK